MRKQLLALLISVPLVASGAAGVVLHVCQSMGGVVVGDCGCEKRAHHGEHATHGDGTKLQAQPCCTVELSNAGQILATQEVSWQQIDEATVALVDRTNSSITASREVCDLGIFRERAPPNVHGPPIFIRNCSFLN